MLIGPFAFEIKEYNGSVPSLVLRPQSWTKVLITPQLLNIDSFLKLIQNFY